MEKTKAFLSLILSIFLLVPGFRSDYVPEGSAENVSTYVALGDSITTGYGLVNFNSNDLKNKTSEYNFVTRLGKKLGKKPVNLGVEGIDTTRMLKSISNPVTAEEKSAVAQIKKAGLITVSIGGNNVFLPMLAALNGQLGNGKTIYNAKSEEIQAAVLYLLFNSDANQKVQKDIAAGAALFTGDATQKKTGEFIGIINAIKKLNPEAQIVVQTIYNPYKRLLPEALGLSKTVDSVIKDMNAEIVKDSANEKNYKVADVYSAFIKAGADKKLLNVDAGKSFDPHPTKEGHGVIYTLLAYSAQNNTLPYEVKSNITKGKLTVKILAGELLLTVTPDNGYKYPQSISLTIGKGAQKTLPAENGTASVPIAEVGDYISVSAVCSK